MKALLNVIVPALVCSFVACNEFPSAPQEPLSGTGEVIHDMSRGTGRGTTDVPAGNPSNVAVRVQENLVTVSWKRNPPYTESGFVVLQASTSPYWNPIAGWASAGDTLYTFAIPFGGYEWSFDVAAYVDRNDQRYLSPSNGASGWVRIDLQVPGTPTDVVGTPSTDGTVLLSWKRSGPFTESYFLIYDHRGNVAAQVPHGSTSCTITGLQHDQSYRFMVMARVLVNGTEYGTPQSSFTDWIHVP
jgi:hypothetical protein